MASPVPKSPATRQRRNRISTAATMEAAPAERIELPTRWSAWKCVSCYLRPGRHTEEFFDKEQIAPHEFEPAEEAWREPTIFWWDTIWASPMSSEWVAGDIPALLVLATLVDEFWRTGDPKVAAEMRLQQREFGLSPLSRRQLQWEIRRLETAKPVEQASTPTRARDPRLRAIS